MTDFVNKVVDAVHKAKSHIHEGAHDLARVKKDKDVKLNDPCVDVTVKFTSASGIPKMDVVGSADPYFVAKINDNVSMVSTVKSRSLTPEWNEIWRVKNVPKTSELSVKVLDKDTDAPRHDDYIGKFKTSIDAGVKECDIEGPLFRKDRGTFRLEIETTPSIDPAEPRYLFDGPIRYSRHFSPTVGRLTNLDDARLYSTWKMYLVGVPIYFGDVFQHWNVDYKAAQSIFGSGPTSLTIRASIHAGHKVLYARSTSNGFGIIESAEDVMRLFEDERPSNPDKDQLETKEEVDTTVVPTKESLVTHRIKPAVYTYIISGEDDSLRFSETGAAFFVDFASKHALHANCAEQVRYSGEFHLRPRAKDGSWCGWQGFDDSMPDASVNWEVLIDNNSGTYSPDKAVLPTLKALIGRNFPGLGVLALDREDEELKKSVDACRNYEQKYRGVKTD